MALLGGGKKKEEEIAATGSHEPFGRNPAFTVDVHTVNNGTCSLTRRIGKVALTAIKEEDSLVSQK